MVSFGGPSWSYLGSLSGREQVRRRTRGRREEEEEEEEEWKKRRTNQ